MKTNKESKNFSLINEVSAQLNEKELLKVTGGAADYDPNSINVETYNTWEVIPTVIW